MITCLHLMQRHSILLKFVMLCARPNWTNLNRIWPSFSLYIAWYSLWSILQVSVRTLGLFLSKPLRFDVKLRLTWCTSSMIESKVERFKFGWRFRLLFSFMGQASSHLRTNDNSFIKPSPMVILLSEKLPFLLDMQQCSFFSRHACLFLDLFDNFLLQSDQILREERSLFDWVQLYPFNLLHDHLFWRRLSLLKLL